MDPFGRGTRWKLQVLFSVIYFLAILQVISVLSPGFRTERDVRELSVRPRPPTLGQRFNLTHKAKEGYVVVAQRGRTQDIEHHDTVEDRNVYNQYNHLLKNQTLKPQGRLNRNADKRLQNEREIYSHFPKNSTFHLNHRNITKDFEKRRKSRRSRNRKTQYYSVSKRIKRKELMTGTTLQIFDRPKYRNITEPPWSYHCQTLHFSEKSLPKIALGSYMGSGNTWLRHLIQEATGIYTGSLYHDPYLYRGGFPGEGKTTDDVILIKMHRAPRRRKEGVEKAILLIRDPFKAILSNFNRHNTVNSNEHMGLAPDELFDAEEWNESVYNACQGWLDVNHSWLQFKGPLLPVLYDDLKNDLPGTMRKILTFLNVTVREENFNCMLKNKEGNFHRVKHHSKVVYDKEMIQHILSQAHRLNLILQDRFNITLKVTAP